MIYTKSKKFYVYLDIEQFPVAWAVYRGEMSATAFLGQENFRPLSHWVCNLIRKKKILRFQKELLLEKIRREYYPNQISRLQGMYFWGDERSAKHAEEEWREKEGRYFHADYLAEVGLSFIKEPSRVDTRWIDTHLLDDSLSLDLNDVSWIHEYWKGNPQGKDPKWEFIVEGKGLIYGTELRMKAYAEIEKRFPHLVGQLEIARIAAHVNRKMGELALFIIIAGRKIRFDYFVNFQDFGRSFLDDTAKYEKQYPTGINRKALGQLQFPQRLPDLRELGGEIDIQEIHKDCQFVIESIVSPHRPIKWFRVEDYEKQRF